nr:uncharacterized protein LOC113711935 isoform X2 [Coffea arabica]
MNSNDNESAACVAILAYLLSFSDAKFANSDLNIDNACINHPLSHRQLCRYCSNTYPRAESYRACNWCLNEKENSFNSSSSNKNATSTEDDVMKVAKKKSVHGGNGGGNGNLQRSNSSIKSEKGSPKLSVIIKNNRSIKKQKSPERSSPLLAARKRITTGSAVQESLRRTKSDISNSGMKKHVFKNRVRRYKLLDEVSS